ncbi:hypothetical protein ABPG73_022930 [Tetrahymena malaccensis]
MIDQIKKTQLIIKNNVLLLAQLSQKNEDGQRNILNKWFQDSVKNYIFEQLGFSLIGKQLKCYNSEELKKYIHKIIDKSKPKYMSIMDKYLYYISKFNQRNIFISKLNSIFSNSNEVSNLEFPLSYKIQRTIRKQFVCYLILHYFEQNDHSEIPSFYELWNICFPEEIQTKKKLSKFDKKNQIKKQVIFKEDEPSINSEDLVNSSNLLSASNQNYNSNIEPLDDPQIITSSIYFINKFHSALNELKTNENCFKNTQIAIISTQKIQINNGIISDGDDEDDQKYNAKYQQINNSNQQKDVNYHQLIEKQQSEQDQYLYEYQYQNLFCQVNQNLQNFDLHYQYTNESNYKFNDQYIYFPNYNQC